MVWDVPSCQYFACLVLNGRSDTETLMTENKGNCGESPTEDKELLFSHVDLLMCHKFMWLKWKIELGSVYSTINLSFKPKDFTTLKL